MSPRLANLSKFELLRRTETLEGLLRDAIKWDDSLDQGADVVPEWKREARVVLK